MACYRAAIGGVAYNLLWRWGCKSKFARRYSMEPTGMHITIRNCQSIKKSFISQIHRSSFWRISPHFAPALHTNKLSCTFLFHVFFSNQQRIRRCLIHRSLHSRLIDFVLYPTFLPPFHLSF